MRPARDSFSQAKWSLTVKQPRSLMYHSLHGTDPAVSAMIISTQSKAPWCMPLWPSLRAELYSTGLLRCNGRHTVHLMTCLQNSPHPRAYGERNDWIIIMLRSRKCRDSCNSRIIFMLSIKEKSSEHLLLERTARGCNWGPLHWWPVWCHLAWREDFITALAIMLRERLRSAPDSLIQSSIEETPSLVRALGAWQPRLRSVSKEDATFASQGRPISKYSPPSKEAEEGKGKLTKSLLSPSDTSMSFNLTSK